MSCCAQSPESVRGCFVTNTASSDKVAFPLERSDGLSDPEREAHTSEKPSYKSAD